MNDKGFTYPLTLCLFLLTSLFLTIVFNQYISEKGVVTEINRQERRQYLFLLMSKEVSEKLLNGEVPVNGVETFNDVTIKYSVSQISLELYEVTYTLIQGSIQIKAVAQYEGKSGKLTKWLLPV
jgi:hypothetical protein